MFANRSHVKNEFTNTKKLVKKLARIEANSICRQQFANVFGDCIFAVHTHQLEFANFGLPCEGRFRFCSVVITILYYLMLQSWYPKKSAQLLVNTLSFSWHNRLLQQQYDLLKTPLITALGAYNSKTVRWNCFILSHFNKHDKTQLLANVKNFCT